MRQNKRKLNLRVFLIENWRKISISCDLSYLQTIYTKKEKQYEIAKSRPTRMEPCEEVLSRTSFDQLVTKRLRLSYDAPPRSNEAIKYTFFGIFLDNPFWPNKYWNLKLFMKYDFLALRISFPVSLILSSSNIKISKILYFYYDRAAPKTSIYASKF